MHTHKEKKEKRKKEKSKEKSVVFLYTNIELPGKEVKKENLTTTRKKKKTGNKFNQEDLKSLKRNLIEHR